MTKRMIVLKLGNSNKNRFVYDVKEKVSTKETQWFVFIQRKKKWIKQHCIITTVFETMISILDFEVAVTKQMWLWRDTVICYRIYNMKPISN